MQCSGWHHPFVNNHVKNQSVIWVIWTPDDILLKYQTITTVLPPPPPPRCVSLSFARLYNDWSRMRESWLYLTFWKTKHVNCNLSFLATHQNTLYSIHSIAHRSAIRETKRVRDCCRCAQPWTSRREGCCIYHYLWWTASIKECSLLFSKCGCYIMIRNNRF